MPPNTGTVEPVDELGPIGRALAAPRRASLVALAMLTAFFALAFPYWSGLEIVRPALQLFYSASAAVYLDLAMLRWRAPRSSFAAWAMALLVQAIALCAVRVKVGHWAWPNALFLVGAALLGLGAAVAFGYLAEFWSGQTARQVYLFGALALFLFWRMTPEAIQAPVDLLLLPDVMLYTGLIGGSLVAAAGWLVYGRSAS
jgi:hypothetical protein